MISLFHKSLFLFIASYFPFVGQYGLFINLWVLLLVIIAFLQHKFKYHVPGVLKFFLLLISFIVVFAEFGSFRSLAPWVSLVGTLGILKLFELKTIRDFFLYATIIELMLVGSFLTVDSIAMIIYMGIITLGMFALMFQHRSSFKGRPWKRVYSSVIAKIFVFSLPLAVILFFIFPRVYIGNFFFNTVAPAGNTGFVERLKPGDFQEIILSNNPIFRATFNGKEPNLRDLYWRVSVLTLNRGFGWEPGLSSGFSEKSYTKEKHFHYRIDFDSLESSMIPLLENSAGLKRLSRGMMLRKTGGTYKIFPLSNQKISYWAETFTPEKTTLATKLRENYIAFDTTQNQRFLKWANNYKGAKDLNSVVDYFFNHLRKENYLYTLKPGSTVAENKLDHFFFDLKKGYCEHFSSAMAIFLRTQGIPTRIITGFHGGLYNDLGNYFLVRGRDAHAWVEAYDEKRGWMRLDPTEVVGVDRLNLGALGFFSRNERLTGEADDDFLKRQSRGMFARIKFLADLVYYDLNQRFLGYDLERQRDLLKKFGIKGKQRLKLTLTVIFIGILFYFLLNLYLKKSDRNEKNPRYWYDRFLKKMAKKGMPILKTEGPMDYLNRLNLEDNLPEHRAIREFVESYIEQRFYREPGPNLLKDHFKKIDFGKL